MSQAAIPPARFQLRWVYPDEGFDKYDRDYSCASFYTHKAAYHWGSALLAAGAKNVVVRAFKGRSPPFLWSVTEALSYLYVVRNPQKETQGLTEDEKAQALLEEVGMLECLEMEDKP